MHGTSPFETSESEVAHHDPMRRIAVIHRRRESLHGSLNSVHIAHGASLSWLVSVVTAHEDVVVQPMVNHFRALKRDFVLRTDPAHRAPRARARVATDAPHDADVVGAHENSASAPTGDPAREGVEESEARDIVGVQILRSVREPAEGGRAGGPAGTVDDQEQLVCGQMHGEGELAGVSEREERTDDVLWVLHLRELAYLWGHATCAGFGAAAVGGLEAWAALDVDERVEVLPEELAAEIARKMEVACGKGVDHEEGVHVGVEEAVKGITTVSELLNYRASHGKGIGGHCNIYVRSQKKVLEPL